MDLKHFTPYSSYNKPRVIRAKLQTLQPLIARHFEKYPTTSTINRTALVYIYPKPIPHYLKPLISKIAKYLAVACKRVNMMHEHKVIPTLVIVGGVKEVLIAGYFYRMICSFFIEHMAYYQSHRTKQNTRERKLRRQGHKIRVKYSGKGKQMIKSRRERMLTLLEHYIDDSLDSTSEIYPQADLIRKEKLRFLRTKLKNLPSWQKITP